MSPTKTKVKPAPEPEIEEEEDGDVVDELEDDETEAPAKKAVDEVTFGASDLARHLAKVTGKKISPRDLRVLLRKMAKDGRIDREILPGNRSRYDWPNGTADPEVKRVIKAVKEGELEAGKREALNRLKEQKAAKDAAAAKAGGKTTKAAKKRAAPVVEEVDEDEDFEVEDDE
jgi:hypothetical protein